MRLTQPDRRSCGAAALVMARRAAHPDYAAQVADQGVFSSEVLSLHRRITSMVDTSGGLQMPWVRAVGTPPWATARELRLITDTPYDIHPVLRGDAWRWIGRATERHPVAVYVGNLVTPRHVVMALSASEAGAWTYEPAAGRMVLVSRARWQTSPLALAGWDRSWFVVAPSGLTPP